MGIHGKQGKSLQPVWLELLAYDELQCLVTADILVQKIKTEHYDNLLYVGDCEHWNVVRTFRDHRNIPVPRLPSQ